MRKFAALVGALVLTLVLAVPATAAQKVFVPERSDSWEFEEQVVAGPGEWDWQWECSEPVYFGMKGSAKVWLWYRDGVKKQDMQPDGQAWPWIRGEVKVRTTYYFSTRENEGGKVIRGWSSTTTRMYRHHLGDAYPMGVYRPVGVDLETWKETTTGVFDSLRHRKVGWIWHSVGIEKGTQSVVQQNREPDPDWVEFEQDSFRGSDTYDDHKICKALGLDYVPFVEP